jgi:hypothetical protein
MPRLSDYPHRIYRRKRKMTGQGVKVMEKNRQKLWDIFHRVNNGKEVFGQEIDKSIKDFEISIIQEGKKEAIEIIENEPIYPYYQGLSIEEALTRFKVKLQQKIKEKNGK